jgi:hypothetical protein
MTQKLIATCNRCGNECEAGSAGMTLHTMPGIVTRFLVISFPPDSVKHLCADCNLAFAGFMKLPQIIAETSGK